ncbi:hypothetical protein TNCV_4600631 [Trichonephila clavipes]|nr:hypothetical protein TNCV_4600631 [Trichonephila clavipes]
MSGISGFQLLAYTSRFSSLSCRSPLQTSTLYHYTFEKTILQLVQVPLHVVYFEASGWRGNCAGHFTVGEIKGGQRLTYIRISAPGCPAWNTFPCEVAWPLRHPPFPMGNGFFGEDKHNLQGHKNSKLPSRQNQHQPRVRDHNHSATKANLWEIAVVCILETDT